MRKVAVLEYQEIRSFYAWPIRKGRLPLHVLTDDVFDVDVVQGGCHGVWRLWEGERAEQAADLAGHWWSTVR